jgi:hypothetical protein
MISDQPRLDEAKQDRSDKRRAMVHSLLSEFQNHFLEIKFQLAPNFAAVNGDAAILAGGRLVHLFGGLAFHPEVTSQALTFALLHETGHHLASGHRSPWDPRLACECSADAWAAGVGTDQFRDPGVESFNLALALKELEVAVGATSPAAKPVRRIMNKCWAMCWSERKRCVKLRTSSPPTPSCPLAKLVLGSQN